ncbi:MAG: C40 family peptidase [Rhodanobacter sp.]
MLVPNSLLPSAAVTAVGNGFANTSDNAVTLSVGATDTADLADDAADATVPASKEDVTDLRKALIALAMNLRDTRYVRGGHSPSTGFDCSGFVRYVFSHAIGIKLPTNSAAQFLDGLKVSRGEMKPGDLVFFHTGRKHRISHVGIYISNGRFIHSPTTGKSVQVSSLSESYWAKHFAGAKRPEAIALAAHNG